VDGGKTLLSMILSLPLMSSERNKIATRLLGCKSQCILEMAHLKKLMNTDNDLKGITV
jgi:hypothetical protein